ncbi:MAG: hypothetical protein HY329_21910 [Chloroflexi bacterium]|nr:hypothetical protein [Chloroflexota bacterium]
MRPLVALLTLALLLVGCEQGPPRRVVVGIVGTPVPTMSPTPAPAWASSVGPYPTFTPVVTPPTPIPTITPIPTFTPPSLPPATPVPTREAPAPPAAPPAPAAPTARPAAPTPAPAVVNQPVPRQPAQPAQPANALPYAPRPETSSPYAPQPASARPAPAVQPAVTPFAPSISGQWPGGRAATTGALADH